MHGRGRANPCLQVPQRGARKEEFGLRHDKVGMPYLHHLPTRLMRMLNFQCKESRSWFGRLNMLGKLLQNLANGLHVEADILQQVRDAQGNRLELLCLAVQPLKLVDGIQLF